MSAGKVAFLAGAVTILALLGGPAPLRAEPADGVDEKLLRDAKVGTDGPGLLAFLRSRSLGDEDRRELNRLIRRLGAPSFRTREQSMRDLMARGQPALPVLKSSLQDPDPEVRRRVGLCVEEIERRWGWAVPEAAVRLLTERKPAGAAEVLLAYLPSVDDEAVQDEVVRALAAVGVEGGKVSPAVAAALRESSPLLRSAAAYVVGRFGTTDQRVAVRGLLADPDAAVRFRSAQALVAVREKEAVPVLLALLDQGPLLLGWRAEEILYRIAGDQAPPASVGAGDEESRRKSRQAWSAWWQAHAAGVDLARAEDGERLLGLTVVAELDTNRVWECGPDGKPRWQLENLQGPIDARVLPGGRHVLIAEHQGMRVTERDLRGEVVWEKRLNQQNPISCQRLPNGNTFIATYNSVLEVDRDGKELYNRTHPTAGMFYQAQKLPNGHILCVSAQAMVFELDDAGKEVNKVTVPTNGGWAGVEGLPGGRLLVASTAQNKVLEIDAAGKVLREYPVPNACAATRLPNGHTLVASMEGRRVVEIDQEGKEVWHVATQGRPFHAHRR